MRHLTRSTSSPASSLCHCISPKKLSIPRLDASSALPLCALPVVFEETDGEFHRPARVGSSVARHDPRGPMGVRVSRDSSQRRPARGGVGGLPVVIKATPPTIHFGSWLASGSRFAGRRSIQPLSNFEWANWAGSRAAESRRSGPS